jgi:hypothetical protein
LRDYHQEYDWPDGRSLDSSGGQPAANPPQAASPVTVNVNINLGDVLDNLISGKKSAREALEELIEARCGKKSIVEYSDDE